MKLKPKIGIDDLKFGMLQKEVYEVLGMPDKKLVDQEDPEQVFMEFHDQQIRLTIFKEENNRLGYIQTSSPDLEFNGHKIINSRIGFAKKEIFSGIIQDWEIEEYDFFSTHSNDEYWTTLNVEYGRVISVEVGVPFADDEEDYDWPL